MNSSAVGVPLNDAGRFSRTIQEELLPVINSVLSSGIFMFGPQTSEFESELSSFLGGARVVTVGNGTDALEIAMKAVGVVTGDIVAMTANAGGYSTTAAEACGARCEYLEIGEDFQIDVEWFTEWLRTADELPKAVVVTHLYGKMAPVEDIVKLCIDRGILVIEDCAQAIGVRRNRQHVGTFGDIATFSFYPTKNLGGAGDSGAVVTNNAVFEENARSLAQYGWGEKYVVEKPFARNSRMDEMQAAYLRVALRKLENRNARRREVFDFFCSELPNIEFPHRDSREFNAHLAVLRSSHRDALSEFLLKHGVASAIHYPIPDHQQIAWRKVGNSLPLTETVARQILTVPCFPELRDEEVEIVADALKNFEG